MLTLSPLALDRTIATMRRLATEYVEDVRPMRWGSLTDIFDGVHAIPYRKDETSVECAGAEECVKRPALTLALGGDCDDKAVVAAAALSLIGVPWRIVTASYRDDGSMTHVYLEVLISGRWFPFDATSPDLALGDELPYHSKLVW